jgi:hypothetical protein
MHDANINSLSGERQFNRFAATQHFLSCGCTEIMIDRVIIGLPNHTILIALNADIEKHPCMHLALNDTIYVSVFPIKSCDDN